MSDEPTQARVLGAVEAPGTEPADLQFARLIAEQASNRFPEGMSKDDERRQVRVLSYAFSAEMSLEMLSRLARVTAEAIALKGSRSGVRPHTPEDLGAALEHYRERSEILEDEHFGAYVTIDVRDGRSAIGATATDAAAEFKQRYGDSHTFTFHIGSTR